MEAQHRPLKSETGVAARSRGTRALSAEVTAGKVYRGAFEIRSVPNCFEASKGTDDSPTTVTGTLRDITWRL